MKTCIFLLIACFAGYGCSKSSNNIKPSQAPNAPAAPVASAPASNAVSSTSFTAAWQKVSGADKYMVYVATDNQFQQPIAAYNPITVTDTSAVISNLNAAANYYYRVKASKNGVVSAYSNTIQITTSAKQWIVSTFAGSVSGNGGFADGQGTAAQFNFPVSITIDASDNLYVLDNNRVRKITPAGLVSTFSGSGTAGTVDGTAAHAEFNAFGITYDAMSGGLFVGDINCIRKIDPLGNVTTVAGNPAIAGVTDGQGTAARLYGVNCLTAGPAGNIFFYEYGNNTGINEAFRKLSPTGYVSTINLSQNLNSGTKGGLVYYNNNLYMGNPGGFNVLEISLAGKVSVFAGLPSSSGAFQNGDISVAKFGYIEGLAIDPSGNFFVIDRGNGLLREISNANVVSTFAGIRGGYGNIEGPALTATMNSPNGIVIDSKGSIFLLDANNNCVRKISYQ